MSGKMHFQTVDLVAPENYSSALKGTVGAASSKDRLIKGFPASPILDETYDPKQVFVDLVLSSDVNDPVGNDVKPSTATGHWGLSSDYKRDYPAPNLLDVKGSDSGGPGSPFTPNAVSSEEGGISTGTGQSSVVDPAKEKVSRAPYVGNDADSKTAQPSATSKQHRDTTLNMFKEELPVGIMGSNTADPPTPIK